MHRSLRLGRCRKNLPLSDLSQLSRSSKRQSDLPALVRHILLHDWDPIGVADTPDAHDEYDSYVSTICRMLVDGVNTTQLRHHLAHTETVNMGLSRPSRNLDVAVQKLLDLTTR